MVDDFFDEIKIYLPQYLSEESLNELFSDMNTFVQDGKSDRIYTTALRGNQYIFQGDCIADMKFAFFPDETIHKTLGVILSNTCDNTSENVRIIPLQLIYAPVLRLDNYISLLKKQYPNNDSKINSHIETIKKQRYTSVFYLPSHPNGLQDDAIVLLDRVSNCLPESINIDSLEDKRKFTLSNYGQYLFLLKISIHFTRIREKIDRNLGKIID